MDKHYSYNLVNKSTDKNKFLARFAADLFSLSILLTIVFPTSYSAQPKYNMILSRPLTISENVIEFEVYIKSAEKNFNLTSYQCAFEFNPKIANSGRLEFSYVPQSSQIINTPHYGVSINHVDDYLKLTFVSWAGSDIITNESLRIGKFRIENTNKFDADELAIKWSFGGNISTILTSNDFQNITNSAHHFYEEDLDKHPGFHKVSEIIDRPTEYKLFQNYPNPFNPTTKIGFSIPNEGHAKMIVYNSLGQEVQILLEDYFQEGTHSVDFIGEELSGGIYFCKLTVDNKFVDIIKMILLK